MRTQKRFSISRLAAGSATFAAVLGLGLGAAHAQAARKPEGRKPRVDQPNGFLPGETGGIPDDLNAGLPKGDGLGNDGLRLPGDPPPTATGGNGSGADGREEAELPVPPPEVLNEVSGACDRAITGCRTALDNCLPTNNGAGGAGTVGNGTNGTVGAGNGALGNGGVAGKPGVGTPRVGGAAGQVDGIGREIGGGLGGNGGTFGNTGGTSGGVLGGTNGGFGASNGAGAGGINNTSSLDGSLAGQPPARKPRWWEKLLGAIAEGVGRGVAGALGNEVLGARDQFNTDMRGISQRFPENTPWIERFGRGFGDELMTRTMREAANRAGIPSRFPADPRFDPRFGNGLPPFATPPFNPNAPDPRLGGDPRFDPRFGGDPRFDPRFGGQQTFPTNDPRFGFPGTGFPDPGFQFPRPQQQQGPVIINNGGTVIVNGADGSVVPRQRRVPQTFPVVDDGAGSKRVQVTLGISFGLGSRD